MRTFRASVSAENYTRHGWRVDFAGRARESRGTTSCRSKEMRSSSAKADDWLQGVRITPECGYPQFWLKSVNPESQWRLRLGSIEIKGSESLPPASPPYHPDDTTPGKRYIVLKKILKRHLPAGDGCSHARMPAWNVMRNCCAKYHH